MGGLWGTRQLDRSTGLVAPPADAAAGPVPVPESFPQWLGENRSYRRDRPLGHGGMGLVYRYRDVVLDRLVAVKTLAPWDADDARRRARFEREAKVLAALDHPHIGRIHHHLEQGGRMYLILEYVPGRTLAEEVRAGRMPMERALAIAAQLAHAIRYGHRCDVIHRDVKPQNIMLAPGNVAKLLDWGLARFLAAPVWIDDAVTTSATDVRPSRTGAGQILGTLGYMSPEQARGEHVDRRCDIWAFGCVLYECLTGAAAFPRPAAPGDAAPQEPRWDLLPDETPAAVRRLLRSCLAPRLDERLDDIHEALPALGMSGPLLPDAPAAGAVPHNLPSPLTSYEPRRGELRRLQGYLRDSRLLTLTGAGGSGKTRLALELARAALEAGRADGGRHYRDGVRFVELAAMTEPRHLGDFVASVVGAARDDHPAGDATSGLIAHLRPRRFLLILDNCEHVREACAALVKALLTRCPHLDVIATSREPLGAPGEQIHSVPGLSYPQETPGDADHYESVRLFLARAGLGRPGYGLTAANRPPISEICRRLEGNPLALELAAARVKSMPAAEVAKRLFEVLDPHRVLDSSIEWSLRLLSEPQRRLLGRLTVFRGGWTLQAAETVCGDGDPATIAGSDVLEVLSELVDRSLVVYEERDDRDRYHLLETVRVCVARHGLLADDEAPPLRQRHLDFFLALAEAADANLAGPDEAAWLNRLQTDHENLRAAAATSLEGGAGPDVAARLGKALHRFWYVRGFADEGRSWLGKVISLRAGARDLLQLRLHNAAGMLAARQRDVKEAEASYQAALALAGEPDRLRQRAGILTNLGLVEQERGRLRQARQAHDESIEIYQSLGDHVGVAMARLNLGTTLKLMERDQQARKVLEQCLPVFEQRGDGERLFGVWQNFGEIACHRLEWEEAETMFKRALRLARDLNDRSALVSHLIWLGAAAERRGRCPRAAQLLAAADALAAGPGVRLSARDQERRRETERLLAVKLDEQSRRDARRWAEAADYDRLITQALEDTSPGTPQDNDTSAVQTTE